MRATKLKRQEILKFIGAIVAAIALVPCVLYGPAALLTLVFMASRVIFGEIEIPSVGENAVERTEHLLTAVQDHPSEPMPDDLVPYYPGALDCWELLQTEMANSENQYNLTITGEHNDRAEEACVVVDFPDATRIEMYYYQSGIEFCTDLSSGVKPICRGSLLTETEAPDLP